MRYPLLIVTCLLLGMSVLVPLHAQTPAAGVPDLSGAWRGQPLMSVSTVDSRREAARQGARYPVSGLGARKDARRDSTHRTIRSARQDHRSVDSLLRTERSRSHLCASRPDVVRPVAGPRADSARSDAAVQDRSAQQQASADRGSRSDILGRLDWLVRGRRARSSTASGSTAGRGSISRASRPPTNCT